MSINNPEQNQQSGITPEQMPPLEPTAEVPPIHSDKLNDPAYWNQKLEGESARVPREHRDDRTEKKGLSTRAKISIGGLALTIIPALGAGLWMKKQMNDVEESMLGGSDRPSASAPVMPGDVPPEGEAHEELLASAGVKLTAEQLEQYNSGDRNSVIDEVFLPELTTALGDPAMMSKIAASQEAMDTLRNVRDDAVSRALGEGPVFEVCKTNALDTEQSAACSEMPSNFSEPGEASIGLLIDNLENFQPVMHRYNLSTINLNLVDDKLVLQ